jgi:hypothetical protein
MSRALYLVLARQRASDKTQRFLFFTGHRSMGDQIGKARQIDQTLQAIPQ